MPWAHGLERPHQVMRRLAQDRQVFFVEEPRTTKGEPFTVVRTALPNLHVVSLRVPPGMSARAVENAQRRSLASLTSKAERPLLWVYSPIATRVARDVEPSLVVYDCVADHAARAAASPEVKESELALLARADLVLTAGTSLFDAKRAHNISTYPLPSSVDAAHFGRRRQLWSRGRAKELSRLGAIPGPRVGFLGPVDERVDLDLVDRLAEAKPSLHIILLGALVGVTKWALPDRPNVHFLGAKDYDDLPDHVASWDAAIFPFRGDVATRRTEPSGLLGCLAAGKAIVSTPLDELAPYLAHDLVSVADAEHFPAAVDTALRQARNPIVMNARRRVREPLLARTSWDRTCSAMFRLVDEAMMAREVRGNTQDQCGRQSAFEASRPPFSGAPGTDVAGGRLTLMQSTLARRMARLVSMVLATALVVALATRSTTARADSAKHGAATASALAQDSAPKPKPRPRPAPAPAPAAKPKAKAHAKAPKAKTHARAKAKVASKNHAPRHEPAPRKPRRKP